MGLLCRARNRVTSSLIKPACTGLPPGELMSKIKACDPGSSKAVRMDDMTFSALASVSGPISPWMVTSAVCGKLVCVAGELRLNTCQTTKPKKSNQAKRMPIFQRRWACCSLRLAKARSTRV
jgi:hypothetical protein